MTTRAQTPQKLITVDELAAWMRVTPKAIHIQRTRGRPPGSLGFRTGHRVLFDPVEIQEWLDAQRGDRA